MQLQTFLKNNRRLARLELRGERIQVLTARADSAGDTALLEKLEKETTRRAAESNYLATRIEADLEDHPEWAAQAAAIREAVLDGSRSSKAAKAILAGAIPTAIETVEEAAAE